MEINGVVSVCYHGAFIAFNAQLAAEVQTAFITTGNLDSFEAECIMAINDPSKCDSNEEILRALLLPQQYESIFQQREEWRAEVTHRQEIVDRFKLTGDAMQYQSDCLEEVGNQCNGDPQCLRLIAPENECDSNVEILANLLHSSVYAESLIEERKVIEQNQMIVDQYREDGNAFAFQADCIRLKGNPQLCDTSEEILGALLGNYTYGASLVAMRQEEVARQREAQIFMNELQTAYIRYGSLNSYTGKCIEITHDPTKCDTDTKILRAMFDQEYNNGNPQGLEEAPSALVLADLRNMRAQIVLEERISSSYTQGNASVLMALCAEHSSNAICANMSIDELLDMAVRNQQITEETKYNIIALAQAYGYNLYVSTNSDLTAADLYCGDLTGSARSWCAQSILQDGRGSLLSGLPEEQKVLAIQQHISNLAVNNFVSSESSAETLITACQEVTGMSTSTLNCSDHVESMRSLLSVLNPELIGTAELDQLALQYLQTTNAQASAGWWESAVESFGAQTMNGGLAGTNQMMYQNNVATELLDETAQELNQYQYMMGITDKYLQSKFVLENRNSFDGRTLEEMSWEYSLSPQGIAEAREAGRISGFQAGVNWLAGAGNSLILHSGTQAAANKWDLDRMWSTENHDEFRLLMQSAGKCVGMTGESLDACLENEYKWQTGYILAKPVGIAAAEVLVVATVFASGGSAAPIMVPLTSGAAMVAFDAAQASDACLVSSPYYDEVSCQRMGAMIAVDVLQTIIVPLRATKIIQASNALTAAVRVGSIATDVAQNTVMGLNTYDAWNVAAQTGDYTQAILMTASTTLGVANVVGQVAELGAGLSGVGARLTEAEIAKLSTQQRILYYGQQASQYTGTTGLTISGAQAGVSCAAVFADPSNPDAQNMCLQAVGGFMNAATMQNVTRRQQQQQQEALASRPPAPEVDPETTRLPDTRMATQEELDALKAFEETVGKVTQSESDTLDNLAHRYGQVDVAEQKLQNYRQALIDADRQLFPGRRAARRAEALAALELELHAIGLDMDADPALKALVTKLTDADRNALRSTLSDEIIQYYKQKEAGILSEFEAFKTIVQENTDKILILKEQFDTVVATEQQANALQIKLDTLAQKFAQDLQAAENTAFGGLFGRKDRAVARVTEAYYEQVRSIVADAPDTVLRALSGKNDSTFKAAGVVVPAITISSQTAPTVPSGDTTAPAPPRTVAQGEDTQQPQGRAPPADTEQNKNIFSRIIESIPLLNRLSPQTTTTADATQTRPSIIDRIKNIISPPKTETLASALGVSQKELVSFREAAQASYEGNKLKVTVPDDAPEAVKQAAVQLEKVGQDAQILYDPVLRNAGKLEQLGRVVKADGTVLTPESFNLQPDDYKGFATQIRDARMVSPESFDGAKVYTVNRDTGALRDTEGFFFSWRNSPEQPQAKFIIDAILQPGSKILEGMTGLGKTDVILATVAYMKKAITGKKVVLIFKNDTDVKAFLSVFNDEAAQAMGFNIYTVQSGQPPRGHLAAIQQADMFISTPDVIFNSLDYTGNGRVLIDSMRGSIPLFDEAHITASLDASYIQSKGATQQIDIARQKRFQELFDPKDGVLGWMTREHLDDLQNKRASSLVETVNGETALSQDVQNRAYEALIKSYTSDIEEFKTLVAHIEADPSKAMN